MAYNGNLPADNDYIAAGPAELRENFRALKDDKIVNAQKLQDLSPGNASGNIPVANGNLNVNLNAEKLGGNLASAFATAGHTHAVATSSSNGMMSNTDKAKLDTVAAGAEVNQNAFSNILVGSTTIQADGKTDTLEMVAGTNIALTPDVTNDRLTVAVTGTVASAAACTGNAATASKLATARTIALTGGVTGSATFDGSANASLATTIAGNAPTATKLATARTINGVAFDGSANITLTAAAIGGNADTVGGAVPGNAANNVLKLDASAKVPVANLPDAAIQQMQIPIRQTVLSGRTDANGQANFLEGGTGLAVNLKATAKPVILAFADGFGDFGAVDYIGKIAADVASAWSGLAPYSTNYLYVERNTDGSLNFGKTTALPAYKSAKQLYQDITLVPALANETSAPGFTVSASSVNGPGWYAWQAFDYPSGQAVGDQGWATVDGTVIGWLEIDLPSARRVVRVGLQSRSYTSRLDMSIKTFTIQGWNGTQWVTLYTSGTEAAWNANETRYYNLSITGYYSKYRFNVLTNQGGSCTAIGQWYLYEEADCLVIPEMTMYAADGTNHNRVYVGEAVTGASTVSNVITYALQGKYISDAFSVSMNTTYSRSHNIGIVSLSQNILFLDSHDNIIYPPNISFYINNSWAEIAADNLDTYTNNLVISVHTGQFSTAKPAPTKMRFYCDRGW